MGFKNERGMMAIGVALMLIVVLPLFGGVLWQYSMAELKRVQKTNDDLQALFLARAGAELAMGALKQTTDHEKRPFGVLDPLYFDFADNKREFTLIKPAGAFGKIDVEIASELASEEGEDEVTVIYSTAVVGVAERTVKMVTYPHRYGHDRSLLWYKEDDGEIIASNYVAPTDLVVMRTKPPSKPIYLGKSTLDARRSNPFAANALIFESPLKLMTSADAVDKSRSGRFDVSLSAERIFLHGLEIAYIAPASFILDYPEKEYSIKLSLPEINGTKGGVLGRDLQGQSFGGTIKDNLLYGEIYFDSKFVAYQQYEYYKRSFLSVKVQEKGTSKDLGLSGKAFYFADSMVVEGVVQENTILDGKAIQEYLNKGGTIRGYFDKAAQDGWLVPIKEEYQIKREDLEGLQPFFWGE